jgi:hypothetical protein
MIILTARTSVKRTRRERVTKNLMIRKLSKSINAVPITTFQNRNLAT